MQVRAPRARSREFRVGFVLSYNPELKFCFGPSQCHHSHLLTSDLHEKLLPPHHCQAPGIPCSCQQEAAQSQGGMSLRLETGTISRQQPTGPRTEHPLHRLLERRQLENSCDLTLQCPGSLSNQCVQLTRRHQSLHCGWAWTWKPFAKFPGPQRSVSGCAC